MGEQRGDDSHLNAKSWADRLLVDHIAIYSCSGRELRLVRLGDPPSLAPTHTCHNHRLPRV